MSCVSGLSSMQIPMPPPSREQGKMGSLLLQTSMVNWNCPINFEVIIEFLSLASQDPKGKTHDSQATYRVARTGIGQKGPR